MVNRSSDDDYARAVAPPCDVFPAGGCTCPLPRREVGTPGGSAAAKFAQEQDRDPLVVIFEDRPRAGAWAYGALGESYVAHCLRRLPPDWFITHDIQLPDGRGNHDHIVVGPAGVVVINSKYHGEQPVLVDVEVYLRGRQQPYVKHGEAAAAAASQALSRTTRLDVAAASMIAIVGDNVRIGRQPASRTVRVQSADDVAGFLHSLQRDTWSCVTRLHAETVRRSATWT